VQAGVYQFTQADNIRIAQMIAGVSVEQEQNILLGEPVIASVSITLKELHTDMMPGNARAISFVVLN